MRLVIVKKLILYKRIIFQITRHYKYTPLPSGGEDAKYFMNKGNKMSLLSDILIKKDKTMNFGDITGDLDKSLHD